MLNRTGKVNDPSYLHPQESHDNGVNCTQNPLWVKGLGGAIHFLEKQDEKVRQGCFNGFKSTCKVLREMSKIMNADCEKDLTLHVGYLYMLSPNIHLSMYPAAPPVQFG